MVSAVSSTSGANTLTGGNSTIAENFEQFLGILLTQLKNQNPLEPLDTNQFTQQLVQFTEVEQSLKSNSTLETIATNTSSSQNMNVVNYLGTKITADGSVTQLTNDEATWRIDSEETASDVAVTIYDANGSIVYQGETSFEAGENSFTWDGTNIVGQSAADGAYRAVFDAKNDVGRSIKVSTEIEGTVTGIEMNGYNPILKVGDAEILLSEVTSVVSS